ncbi:MAG: nucleotide sugar dehydrogenase [Candidatus Obscuribacterales bacterium]|nr:nucleotide sugar dehydrogenase [Candidatus Obscuribacterales bacterium]
MTNESLSELSIKIESNKAVVGIIGLGYVGLPLLQAFYLSGFSVIGFDTDQLKIELLSNGQSYLSHLDQALINQMFQTGRCQVTGDLRRFSECDALISCVPTPLGENLQPDLSFVEKTAEDIARNLRRNQLVVLESSTYPGTTREILLPVLSAGGLRCGEDFFLAYSPEREDPGRKNFTTQTIPKLVGGIDDASCKLACSLYSKAIRTIVPVSSAEVAEAAKMLENIYRSVNIALVNEMKIVLSKMGIDIWEVIEAAASKPFGFEAFYPGPGLGGHCLPIDPYYMAWRARKLGVETKFIELSGEVNRAMPAYVVSNTTLALNKFAKAVNGSKILILGVAYKPNVEDVRESPGFTLIEMFRELGAQVDYNDPYVPQTRKTRRHNLLMKSIPLSAQMLASYDCVVVATDHSSYDWQLISNNAKLIIDTRNALKHAKNRRAHIIKS